MLKMKYFVLCPGNTESWHHSASRAALQEYAEHIETFYFNDPEAMGVAKGIMDWLAKIHAERPPAEQKKE